MMAYSASLKPAQADKQSVAHRPISRLVLDAFGIVVPHKTGCWLSWGYVRLLSLCVSEGERKDGENDPDVYLMPVDSFVSY